MIVLSKKMKAITIKHSRSSLKEVNQVTSDSKFGYYCNYCGGKSYK